MRSGYLRTVSIHRHTCGKVVNGSRLVTSSRKIQPKEPVSLEKWKNTTMVMHISTQESMTMFLTWMTNQGSQKPFLTTTVATHLRPQKSIAWEKVFPKATSNRSESSWWQIQAEFLDLPLSNNSATSTQTTWDRPHAQLWSNSTTSRTPSPWWKRSESLTKTQKDKSSTNVKWITSKGTFWPNCRIATQLQSSSTYYNVKFDNF